MKIIGITGGVGSGKTQVLSYIEKHYKCRIVRSDETAHLLYEPGMLQKVGSAAWLRNISGR